MKIKILVTLLGIYFFLNTATAEELPQKILTHSEAIDQIMDLSGLSDQVPQIADTVVTGFIQQQNQFPEELREEVMKIITLSFNGDKMLDTVRKEVERKVSLEEAKELLQWYRSILGMQITNLEKAPQEAADYQVMMEQEEELVSDTERASLCKKIDKAGHLTEFSLEIQIGIMRSTLKMMQPEADEKALKKYLEDTRAKMKEQMEELQLLSLLYAYRELETEELLKYADFLSKDTSQAFLYSANAGINKAIMESTEQMLKALIGLNPTQNKTFERE